MAYEFVNQEKSNAIIQVLGTGNKYKFAGLNGKQTDANNFQTAIMGLLHVVGKDTEVYKTGRAITQEVEERGIKVTPMTVAASEFGGRQDEYTLEYVTFLVKWNKDQWLNPKISAQGKIPVECNVSAGIKSSGVHEIKFERVMPEIQTGTTNFTFTITLRENDGSRTATETVTITGGSGDGYEFNVD